MITPRPSSNIVPFKPGCPMTAFFGVEPVLMSNEGKVVKGNRVSGNLCIRAPWPSLARNIYGNDQKFRETYFKRFPGL